METAQENQVMASVFVEQLIAYGRNYLSLSYLDTFTARNALMELLHLGDRSEELEGCEKELEDILKPLVSYALAKGYVDEMDKERFGVRLTACVMPSPQETVDKFDSICFAEGVRAACTWFYDLCQKSGYIPIKSIMRNPHWHFTGEHGEINVTINTAKPEKDPKEVAAAKAAPQSGYPKCLLCIDNVGYGGRVGWPARGTLRVLPLPRDNEMWFMQYSPYSYFSHHCIFFNAKHQPMELGEESYRRLIDFVEMFPYYFIGSNAPLPIVGGSILAHDHYQGGGKVHPMFARALRKRYTCPAFANVKIGTVDWFNSVVRLKSRDRAQLVKATAFVANMWAMYSDPEANILCRTGDAPHNCVTPIFRMERGEMYAELILRNNRTDEAHPYGIFHPTEDMHHIKKESIGIIEVLGTFILPGRLAAEMSAVADILCGATPFDEKVLSDEANPLSKHKNMIVSILKQNGFAADNAAANVLVQNYINDVCERILNCTAVFKNDEAGQAAFDRFMRSLGCNEFLYKLAEDAQEKEPAAEPVAAAVEPVAPVSDPAPAVDPAPVAPAPKRRGRPPKKKD